MSNRFIVPSRGINLYQARGGKRLPRKLKKRVTKHSPYKSLTMAQRLWSYVFATNKEYSLFLQNTVIELDKNSK